MSNIDHALIHNFFQTYGKKVSDSPNDNLYVIDRADTEFAYHMLNKNLNESSGNNNLETIHQKLAIASIARSSFYDGSGDSLHKVITSNDVESLMDEKLSVTPTTENANKNVKNILKNIVETLFPI